MQNTARGKLHWWLAVGGIAVVAYSLWVQVVVATAPDIRLRWLLIDADAGQPGILIQKLENPITDGPTPEVGDRLLSIDGTPVAISVEATRRILRLSTVMPQGGPAQLLPITFQSARQQAVIATNIAVRPVPSTEIAITLVWFMCQVGILGMGAIAFWKRPFDRPVRLFYAMCIVTLGAFVGAYHWWLLSGSPWLTLPFVVCALLVPSVTLHFFLVYPQPKRLIRNWHRSTLWALYAPPLTAAIGFMVMEFQVWYGLGGAPSAIPSQQSLWWLQALRGATYGYVGLAAAYFAATMTSLLHSVWTTQPILERRQVTFILSAAILASLLIGYTLVLAGWDRVEFALGGARVPMFLASLLFMAAYAIGVVRFKLMLTEESIARGWWQEGFRLVGALGVGCFLVPVMMVIGRIASELTWASFLTILVVWMLVTAISVSARDVLQRQWERRLFRERFRLEKALQRIHRAVGQFADPQFLSERTLAACCDVLQTEWAALYLKEVGEETLFRLSGIKGAMIDLPLTYAPRDGFLRMVELNGGVVSTYGDRRSPSTMLTESLDELQADLIHLLEIDGDVAGLIVLGPKSAGGIYSGEDGTFLTALTQLTGVALHCVRVHQDLTQMNEQLRVKIDRIAQQRQQILMLQAELASTRPGGLAVAEVTTAAFRRDAIKGSGSAISAVLEMAQKAAVADATVLIRGESGTGKELLAQAIHENSPRRKGPMVAVHCAALSPALLESELFGHVKGAFTGAQSDRQGRFELANGGTLFLDEIGEISLETQVKLLRVLQQRVVEPVGSATAIPVDVRLVAATHRNLEQLIADGLFREDLYYRLNVITLTIPALRERQEDLQELAREFLRRAAERSGRHVVDFDESVIEALLKYRWPGNIRELENVIERAVILADGDVLKLEDLPFDLVNSAMENRSHALALSRGSRGHRQPAVPPVANSVTASPRAGVDERTMLREALQNAGGNKAQAAKLLGLPRSTFFSKLKKYGLGGSSGGSR